MHKRKWLFNTCLCTNFSIKLECKFIKILFVCNIPYVSPSFPYTIQTLRTHHWVEQSSTSFHHQLVNHSSSNLYILRFWLLTTSFSTILIITDIHTHRNNLKVLASHFLNSSEILYSDCPALNLWGPIMGFVITNDLYSMLTFILSIPVLQQLPSFQLIYSWISMATVTHRPPETPLPFSSCFVVSPPHTPQRPCSLSLPAFWSPLLRHPILPSFPAHVLGIAPSHNSSSQCFSTWWRPPCSNPALHTGTTASERGWGKLYSLDVSPERHGHKHECACGGINTFLFPEPVEIPTVMDNHRMPFLSTQTQSTSFPVPTLCHFS